MLVKVVAPG